MAITRKLLGANAGTYTSIQTALTSEVASGTSWANSTILGYDTSGNLVPVATLVGTVQRPAGIAISKYPVDSSSNSAASDQGGGSQFVQVDTVAPYIVQGVADVRVLVSTTNGNAAPAIVTGDPLFMGGTGSSLTATQAPLGQALVGGSIAGTQISRGFQIVGFALDNVSAESATGQSTVIRAYVDFFGRGTTNAGCFAGS